MFNVQLLSGLLLVCNSLFLTFTRTSVILCALSTNRETITMTHSTIATYIHQSLNVQLNLRAEITFYFEFSTDNFADLGSLVVTPFVDFQVTAHAGFVQYLC